MTVPACLAAFIFIACDLYIWAKGQMYAIVLSLMFFFNYPRVCAWLRCLFASFVMTGYTVALPIKCDFPARFPIETILGIFLLIMALLILATIEFELLARADFYSHVHEETEKKVTLCRSGTK